MRGLETTVLVVFPEEKNGVQLFTLKLPKMGVQLSTCGHTCTHICAFRYIAYTHIGIYMYRDVYANVHLHARTKASEIEIERERERERQRERERETERERYIYIYMCVCMYIKICKYVERSASKGGKMGKDRVRQVGRDQWEADCGVLGDLDHFMTALGLPLTHTSQYRESSWLGLHCTC